MPSKQLSHSSPVSVFLDDKCLCKCTIIFSHVADPRSIILNVTLSISLHIWKSLISPCHSLTQLHNPLVLSKLPPKSSFVPMLLQVNAQYHLSTHIILTKQQTCRIECSQGTQIYDPGS